MPRRGIEAALTRSRKLRLRIPAQSGLIRRRCFTA
jgi:hypothetical protein